MRQTPVRPLPLVAALLCALLARPAFAAPVTHWAHFPVGPFPVGAATTVPLSDSASVDVTVQTGGTQGVSGGDLDTLGSFATGLDYAHLYELGIFNGGGFGSVATSLTFTNVRVASDHVRGLLMVGAVNGASSPITVTSSVAGRVATWTVVGEPFAFGSGNDFAITWDAGSGTFATGAMNGDDSRCLVIDLGDLRSDGTITVSLGQNLNDGIVYAFGEETERVLDVAPGAGPASLALAPPRPNPARGATTLEFSLAAASVRLDAFDAAGRRIATLADGAYPAGSHAVRWDLRDRAGEPVPAGLVFVRLATPGGSRTRRLFVVR